MWVPMGFLYFRSLVCVLVMLVMDVWVIVMYRFVGVFQFRRVIRWPLHHRQRGRS